MFLRSVDLFLPKFSISAEASLGETLKELGITDAFTDDADFSGMSDEIKLKVSKVGSAVMPSRLLLDLRALAEHAYFMTINHGRIIIFSQLHTFF